MRNVDLLDLHRFHIDDLDGELVDEYLFIGNYELLITSAVLHNVKSRIANGEPRIFVDEKVKFRVHMEIFRLYFCKIDTNYSSSLIS